MFGLGGCCAYRSAASHRNNSLQCRRLSLLQIFPGRMMGSISDAAAVCCAHEWRASPRIYTCASARMARRTAAAACVLYCFCSCYCRERRTRGRDKDSVHFKYPPIWKRSTPAPQHIPSTCTDQGACRQKTAEFNWHVF